MKNPPWAMLSLDLRFAMIPWATSGFDRSLLHLFSTGTAIDKHFGDILPLAFITSGGPGDSKETAFAFARRMGPARASAEHWLMRAYLQTREEGIHSTILSDATGQTFSMHGYTDQDGIEKRVFFETTESSGREEEDFLEFLHRES